MEFIKEIEVSDVTSAKIKYNLFKVGDALYVAKPSKDLKDDNLNEVYLEKDSEGWKLFTPVSTVKTPESISQKLLSVVVNYYDKNEKEDRNEVSFNSNSF